MPNLVAHDCPLCGRTIRGWPESFRNGVECPHCSNRVQVVFEESVEQERPVMAKQHAAIRPDQIRQQRPATYQYHVEVFKEGALSSILFGAASTRLDVMHDRLNELGSDGWKLVHMEREIQRLWLFWTREAMVAVLMREVA